MLTQFLPGGSYIISLKQSILVINSQQQPFESLRVMTLGDVDRHLERFRAVERGSETYLTHSASATTYVTGHLLVN